MTFKTRFIILAMLNCSLLIGFYYLFSSNAIETSKRLIDLSISDNTDRQAFFIFLTFMLGAFLGNFAILSSSRSELTKHEVEDIINLIRTN